MRTRSPLLAVTLLVAIHALPAGAACKEKRSRDPSFIELAVPDGAIRPVAAQDFAFVNDETTYEQLVAKVGPPDASQGTRISQFIWCFADGTELGVFTRDQVAIEQIRHNGKLVYKRTKKK
ncbi:MAG TPA: hypothetical protein VM146_13010 [Steroidobacteraceae bacterium]|nr:hypothetical protein [Steroidobacteraceae bacterium]